MEGGGKLGLNVDPKLWFYGETTMQLGCNNIHFQKSH
jgi:hypothetical protein